MTGNPIKRMGLGSPIIQAPMAGVSTVEMAAAVTSSGGLGSIAIGAMEPGPASDAIQALRRETSGPFNVNLFCHQPASSDPDTSQKWLRALSPLYRRFGTEPPGTLREIYKSFVADDRMQEVILDLKPPVVSFHFGLPPADVVKKLRSVGVVLLATATNLEEADKAAALGMDAVVAQGYEAGGHRGVFNPSCDDAQLGVLALVRLLVEKGSLPVIAAGAIMDGAGIAAVLKLGACAAQMGTAFVACPESAADSAYRRALLSAGAARTEMTSVVSGRPARSLPNAMTALRTGILAGARIPDYPLAYDANKALAAAAKANGEFGYTAQWAGQGAPLVRPMPAAALMSVLREELAEALAGPAAGVI